MKVNLICPVYIMLAIQYLYLHYPWYIILPSDQSIELTTNMLPTPWLHHALEHQQ